MKFLMISLFTPFLAKAMCSYPHNPPVVCLKGKVLESKTTKKTNINCSYQVKTHLLIRPGRTYWYNDDLDLETYKTPKKLKNSKVKLYAKNKKCLSVGSEVNTMARYNCSTENSSVPDLVLIDQETLSKEVNDPWKRSLQFIDCNKDTKLAK